VDSARWAGFGNNRESDEKGNEGMRSERTMQDKAVNANAEAAEMDAAQETAEEPAASGAAELEQLKGERDQLMDRLARLQAEFDNARKREVKERAEAREYAVLNAVEPFLSVMDNFKLALKAEGSAEQLRDGVELILKQMEEALKGLNVQPIEAVGAQFDPRIHEALGSIETVEHPDHQVLEEVRRGYKIRERLLRPALVRIAVNPKQVKE